MNNDRLWKLKPWTYKPSFALHFSLFRKLGEAAGGLEDEQNSSKCREFPVR